MKISNARTKKKGHDYTVTTRGIKVTFRSPAECPNSEIHITHVYGNYMIGYIDQSKLFNKTIIRLAKWYIPSGENTHNESGNQCNLLNVDVKYSLFNRLLRKFKGVKYEN